MFRHLRGRMTFSNVIVLLVLFIALGGTVYAASKINGKQIKANSIPGNRVKKHSLTSTQLKGSAVTDVASALAISRVSYTTATATLPSNGSNAATATCPAGQKVLGGGETLASNQSVVSSGGPTADRAGWRASGGTGASGDTLTVTAICAPVLTTTP